MKISEINPFVRYVKMHKSNHGLVIAGFFRYCYDCRLFFFQNCEGWLLADGRQYKISNQTAVYLPFGTRYRFAFPETDAVEAIVINFDFDQSFSDREQALRMGTDEDFDPDRVHRTELPPEFAELIVRQTSLSCETLIACEEEFLLMRTWYRESTSARIKGYLLELLRERFLGTHTAEAVKRVTDFIGMHYADVHLTNDDIAKQFGYHPYYLSNLVKRATGKSLRQYLIYYRIQVAKGLLSTTALSVETVAWKCGFQTTAYFIKTFRLQVGVTPKKYAERNAQAEL